MKKIIVLLVFMLSFSIYGATKIAEYELDGDAIDITGNHDGILIPGWLPTMCVPDINLNPCTAINFNNEKWLSAQNSPDWDLSGDFSITLNVKLNAIDTGTLVSAQAGIVPADGWHLEIDSAHKLVLHYGDGVDYVRAVANESAGVLNDLEWHTITVIKEDTGVTFYIDNGSAIVAVNEGTGTFDIDAINYSNSEFKIASGNGMYDNLVNGSFDKVVIWDGAIDNLVLDPIAWYKFEGNMSDSSGYNGTASHTLGLMYRWFKYKPRIDGTSAFFRNNAYVRTYVGTPGLVDEIYDFTMSMWFKFDPHIVYTGTRYMFDSRDWDNDYIATGFSVYMQTTTTSFSVTYTVQGMKPHDGNTASWGSTLTTAQIPRDNEKWYNLIVQRKDNIMYIYIDGQLIASKSTSDRSIKLRNTWTIGSYGEYVSSPFHGFIDEFMLFNRALSPIEINKLYLTTEGM